MYFHSATEHLATARQGRVKIEVALKAVDELQRRFDAIKDDTSREHKAESLAIQLEGREYDLSCAYAPVLASLSAVHLLAAASIEAHINQRAKDRLKGKDWDYFERMSAESKWLFFPRLIGRKGLDPGEKPYQQLASLISRRNKLIHYKPRQEPWHPPGVPTFLSSIGLSFEDAEASVTAVREAVIALAVSCGDDVPRWIQNPASGGFFECHSSHASTK